MIRLLGRLAVGTALLSTLAFTYPNVTARKHELLFHTPANGMTCVLDAVNYDISPIAPGLVTTVQFEPKIGGFSFGTSGVFVEPAGSNAPLRYDDPYGLSHYVAPGFGFTWETYTTSAVPGNAVYVVVP